MNCVASSSRASRWTATAVSGARVKNRVAPAELRIAAQLPIEEKAGRGDYVIDTSGTFDRTNAQVERVWTALNSLAAARR